MDTSSTTAYWTAAVIILILLVIGAALWFGGSNATPGTPNTGASTDTTYQTNTVPADQSYGNSSTNTQVQ